MGPLQVNAHRSEPVMDVRVAPILGALARFSVEMDLLMIIAFLLAGTRSDNSQLVLRGMAAGDCGIDRYLLPPGVGASPG
jgi:hypothetical protein